MTHDDYIFREPIEMPPFLEYEITVRLPNGEQVGHGTSVSADAAVELVYQLEQKYNNNL